MTVVEIAERSFNPCFFGHTLQPRPFEFIDNGNLVSILVFSDIPCNIEIEVDRVDIAIVSILVFSDIPCNEKKILMFLWNPTSFNPCFFGHTLQLYIEREVPKTLDEFQSLFFRTYFATEKYCYECSLKYREFQSLFFRTYFATSMNYWNS